MNLKIENKSSGISLPRKTEETIERILKTIPREHLRGLDRLRLVNSIEDPRRTLQNRPTSIPGLYHPKQGSQPAWLEIAINVLLPQNAPFYRKLLPRLSFKMNLAAVIFSLVGQHHYLTLRHSVKRGQIEGLVRTYTEKLLEKWNGKEHSLRTRIFKPLQPTFERWARSLQRRAKQK
jgi:hypothetical protein